MLLPQQIAEQLKPDEYVELVGRVEDMFHQKFGVVEVIRSKGNVTVEVELEDRTRHDVLLHQNQNQ